MRNGFSDSRLLVFVFEPKKLKQVVDQSVFHTSADFLARNDVSKVRHREDVFLHGPCLCLSEALDAVRCENEIEILYPPLRLCVFA